VCLKAKFEVESCVMKYQHPKTEYIKNENFRRKKFLPNSPNQSERRKSMIWRFPPVYLECIPAHTEWVGFPRHLIFQLLELGLGEKIDLTSNKPSEKCFCLISIRSSLSNFWTRSPLPHSGSLAGVLQ